MGIHTPTAFTKLVRKLVPRAVRPWLGWGQFRRVGVDFDAIFHACVYRPNSQFDSDPVPVRVARYVRPMQMAGCEVIVFTDGRGHRRAKADESRRRTKLRERATVLHSLKLGAADRIETLIGTAAGGGGGAPVVFVPESSEIAAVPDATSLATSTSTTTTSAASAASATLAELRAEAKSASEASTLIRRELLDLESTEKTKRCRDVECPFDCDETEMDRVEAVVLREAFGCSREEKLERMRAELAEALRRSAVLLRDQAAKSKEALDSRAQLASADMRAESLEALRQSGCEIRTSVGEAEIEAAHAMGSAEIDCVAGQDTDLFLGPGKGTFVQHPHSDRLRTAWQLDEVAPGLGLTQKQLVDAAQVIGTDFCSGIKGFGAVKAVRAIKTHGSAEKVAEACRVSAKLAPNVPDGFLDQLRTARLVFANTAL